MRQLGIEFEEVQIPLRQPASLERKLSYSPAGKVPILVDGDMRIGDSLVIMEHPAEKFPEKRLWPADREARTLARSVSAEMHSGFASARTRMPMNCRAHRPDAGRGTDVQETSTASAKIWRECHVRYEAAGEFLFGEFTAAVPCLPRSPHAFRLTAWNSSTSRREYAGAIFALPAVKE